MLFPNAGVEVNPALLLLLGLMAGTLSGFFGVGGGFLITGGLLVFGVPPIFAVGTGFTLIMGNSLINTIKHRHIGNVDFKLGALILIGTIPALILAERTNSKLEAWEIEGPVLRYIYVVFLLAMGSFLLYDFFWAQRRRTVEPDQVSTMGLAKWVRALKIPPESIGIPGFGSWRTYVSLPNSGIDRLSIWVPVAMGFVVGFLAGLLGAGGGFLLMPALVFGLGVPTTIAVGTDLFQIVITGSVGTLLYALSNHVDLLMAVIMLAAASLGSQIGVAATRYVDGSRLRFLFGISILSGSVAVALKQASETNTSVEFLSIVGTIVLLGVAGAICVVIAAMLFVARGRSLKSSPTGKAESGPRV